MVRAVLDTTILASIATSCKVSRIKEIADLWLLHAECEVVLSTYIYTEFEGVLQKPYSQSRLTQEEIKNYLQTVRESSTFVKIERIILINKGVIVTDPKYFLYELENVKRQEAA
jgi:predicted nucleic acid-binding protein